MKKILILPLFLLVSCTNKYQDLYQSLDETLAIVEEHYPEAPDIQAMRVAMLQGLIKSINPCSFYLNEGQIKFLLESADGTKPRFGMNIAKHNEGIEIKKIFEKSPAELAGLKIGDVICEFEGQSVKGMPIENFPSLIKEIKSYKITVLRGTNKLNVEITPSDCSTIEFKWFSNVAYLKLDFISNDYVRQIKDYLNKIKTNPKATALILDLRDSPGGSFEAAMEISELFLDGHPIIEVQKKDNFYKIVSAGKDQLNKLPMFVLQNRNTYSAAEIISAALKCNKRAKVIGQNSGGSATAKFVLYFPNRKDGLIIPSALLNDPNGKRIGKNGVEPDILIEETKIQESKSKDLYILEALRFVPVK